MPYFEHEISVKEFIDECDDYDLSKIVAHLRKTNRIGNKDRVHEHIDSDFSSINLSVGQTELYEALKTIAQNMLRLTNEQHEQIISISKHF